MSNTLVSTSEQAKAAPTIECTVFFQLSLEGQKAALLAGLPAAQRQKITGQIQATYLDLCAILPNGRVIAATHNVDARDFSPEWRYIDGVNYWTSIRINGSGQQFCFDVPPANASEALDMIRAHKQSLFVKAEEERSKENASRLADAMRDGERMNADPSYIPATGNKPWYDMSKEMKESAGVAPIWAEIRRRIDADASRAAEEKAAKKREAEAKEEADRARQNSVKEFIAGWVAKHGHPDQVERYEAGLLPSHEYLNLMDEQAFSPLAGLGLTPYRKITEEEVRAADPRDDEYDDEKCDFRVMESTEISAEAWEMRKRILVALPGAEVTFRDHQGERRSRGGGDGLHRLGIQVKTQMGPLVFIREYTAD